MIAAARRRVLGAPAHGLSYNATILAEGNLSHFYKFDETSGTVAADSQGAVDGTITGTVSLNQSPVFSDATASIYFNGGYVIMPSRLVGPSNWTVEMEVLEDPILVDGVLFSLGDGSIENYMRVEMFSSSLRLNGSPNVTIATFSAITITPGVPFHSVFTYNGTTLTAYINGGTVNGGQQDAVSYSQASNLPGDHFLIGWDKNGTNARANISKPAVYGTAILSQPQITTHWLAVNNP